MKSAKKPFILHRMRSIAFRLCTGSVLLLLFVFNSFAQLHGAGGGKVDVKEGLGRTWKGPTRPFSSRSRPRRPRPGRSAASPASRTRPTTSAAPAVVTAPGIKFKPGPDTGLADLLAAAFTTNAD